MVIITAAINNPAPSHTIPAPSHTSSALGAAGDLDLARATGGTFLLRINFTCTPKIVKGPAVCRPSAGTAFLHPEHQLRGLWGAVQYPSLIWSMSVVALEQSGSSGVVR